LVSADFAKLFYAMNFQICHEYFTGFRVAAKRTKRTAAEEKLFCHGKCFSTLGKFSILVGILIANFSVTFPNWSTRLESARLAVRQHQQQKKFPLIIVGNCLVFMSHTRRMMDAPFSRRVTATSFETMTCYAVKQLMMDGIN